MKGSYIVIIILLLVILTGFFVWLWIQGYNGNQESITASFNNLIYSAEKGPVHLFS